MKKITFFLLSVIFAFSFVSKSVNAQIEIERPQIPNIFPEIEMPDFEFSDGTYVIDTVITYNDYWNNRYSYSYNDAGKMIMNSLEKFVNNTWEYLSRSTNTFDENDKLLYTIDKNWEENNWVNANKRLLIYDENDNIIWIYKSFWNITEWKDTERYYNTYDEEGNMLTNTFEEYLNEEWQIKYQKFYTYDENQNLLSGEHALWEDNNWQVGSRFSCTYDENDNQLTYLREYYIDNTWVNKNNINYYYSPEGYYLSSISYYWANEEWVEVSKREYENDDFGNTIIVENYQWIDGSWVSKSDYATIRYNDGNSMRSFSGYRVEVHYSTLSGIDEITNNVFSDIYCSPNPANNYSIVNINLSDNINAYISLFDIQGNKLEDIYKGKLQKGQHQFNVNLEDLSAGVYFVNLTSGKASETLKIIHTR